jgi:hypothetical protein
MDDFVNVRESLSMDAKTKKRIKELLSGIMQKIIEKRTVKEPFRAEDVEMENPFGYRLVPLEIWKGSKFERSFVTSLGQGVFEQIAKIIAEGTGAHAENQYSLDITINTYRAEKIEEIIAMHRSSRREPGWDVDVNEILALQNQRHQDLRVNFDLYIRRATGKEEFYSIKTVKPNLDQTEIAKRDMLRIKAAKKDCEPYFALPFNPAGESGDYRSKHAIPYKIFNMDKDQCVLIGSKFWNKVGGDSKTYEELLQVFEEVGKIYEPKIRRDYLGL